MIISYLILQLYFCFLYLVLTENVTTPNSVVTQSDNSMKTDIYTATSEYKRIKKKNDAKKMRFLA